MTTVLLCTAVLFACFCKKEKCPKLSDEQKNTMGYKGGEQFSFFVKDYVNSIIDTVVCTVTKTVDEGNIPCSHPTKGGNCTTLFRLVFNNNYYGIPKNESEKGLNFDPIFY